jgi:hypothetical protein
MVRRTSCESREAVTFDQDYFVQRTMKRRLRRLVNIGSLHPARVFFIVVFNTRGPADVMHRCSREFRRTAMPEPDNDPAGNLDRSAAIASPGRARRRENPAAF